jgi:hypothetical protein
MANKKRQQTINKRNRERAVAEKRALKQQARQEKREAARSDDAPVEDGELGVPAENGEPGIPAENGEPGVPAENGEPVIPAENAADEL